MNPPPTPQAMVEELDADRMVQAARAEAARRALAARAALHDPPPVRPEAVDDDEERRGMLQAALDSIIEDRRQQLARELEAERAAASELIARAREEAAAIIAAVPPRASAIVAPEPPSADYVAQIVQAAVSATLAQVRSVPAVTPRSVRPPLRQRLLHLDVVLPSILAVVVLVVLLAWVG